MMPLEMLFFERPLSCAAKSANEVLSADSSQEGRQPGSSSAAQPVVTPGSSSAAQLVVIPASSNAAQPAEDDGNNEVFMPDEGREEPFTRTSAQPSDDLLLATNSKDGTLEDSAVQPADDVEGSGAEGTDEEETLAEDEDAWSVQTFSKTTSLYDDWLHRGPYLYEMDLHNYIRFIQREQKPEGERGGSVIDRGTHVILFDEHYVLARTHWQTLGHGSCMRVLPVLEALKCPPPSKDNEDNAIYKSLFATLLRCPGPDCCADPLLFRPAFFQTGTAKYCVKKQWMARRSEIEYLMREAKRKTQASQRIPVLLDTTLFRGWCPVGAEQPACHVGAAQPASLRLTSSLLICWTQLCRTKTGTSADPRWSSIVLGHLGWDMNHPHQLHLAEFCAWHLAQVVHNVDMLAIARTSQIMKKDGSCIEDEPTDVERASKLSTEFYGGEGQDVDDAVMEEVPEGDAVRSEAWLNLPELISILVREEEVAAAKRKGRQKSANKQMKLFDDAFHSALHSPVPSNDVVLSESQLGFSGAHPAQVTALLQYQDAVMKTMKAHQPEVAEPEDIIRESVLHNLRQLQDPGRNLVDLPDALRGPAHVAKLILRRAEDKASTPAKPFRYNNEQLECIAAMVAKLEPAFAEREDPSKPMINPAKVITTAIYDGGGGCGKTDLLINIMVPLFEVFFGPHGVLKRAPGNKAARIIGGTTIHSSQGLSPESSLRTHSLTLNLQTRQKMSRTVLDVGAMAVDECSQLQGELNHADSLRMTYAREHKYGLNALDYWKPTERHGRIAVSTYWGDHLQLPPVPASTSMLASFKGSSNEHKAGANIFRNADMVFQFEKMMRFTDKTLIEILEVMRAPKPGKLLTREQWQKLRATDVGAAQPDVPLDWYQSCYCWSVTNPASFAWARRSAREAKQTLFYAQAVDTPAGVVIPGCRRDFFRSLLKVPSVQQTGRLPAVVFWHYGMRIRFTTTLQPPFAVQDVEGKVVGFEPDPSDPSTQDRMQCSSDGAAEHHCGAMPLCIYVKIDDCQLSLLPEDFGASAEQRGVFAVKPIKRTWKYALPDAKDQFVNVRRKQFPIMPARVVPLYSMQGTTADPGLVAYWCFPDFASETVKWLIVYVMLSRPRSLDTLRSVGLGMHEEKIRALIEGGAPEDLVQSFHDLFGEKISATKQFARQAAERYGFLPHVLRDT